jgi:hypothetical protein
MFGSARDREGVAVEHARVREVRLAAEQVELDVASELLGRVRRRALFRLLPVDVSTMLATIVTRRVCE